MLVSWTGLGWIAVRQRMQYRFDFLMTLLSTLMYSGLFYLVWRAVYAHQEEQVMPWPQLITYVMVGQAVNVARWSPAERVPVYTASSRIRNGDIALDLIRPVDFQALRFLEAAGFFAVELLWVNLPTIALFVLVFGVLPPPTLLAATAFLCSLVLAFVVSFALNSMVIMVAFWTTNMLGAQMCRRGIAEIFSGTLIPFEFFPGWLRAVAAHLPFQAMGYIPLSIYIGRVAGLPAIGYALLEQVFWAALMLGASRLLWRFAFKRVEVYGG